MKIITFPDGRISRSEAAKYIGIKSQTLSSWNSRGIHDEYFKKIVIAGKVYYSFESVEKFCLDAQGHQAA